MQRTAWLAMMVMAAACSLPELSRLDPCVQVPAGNNGAYCGSSTSHGFTATSSPAELITCIDQRTVDVATCRSACVITSDVLADRCDTDPCTAVTVDGHYCGSSSQNGFDPTQASHYFLYMCQGGKTMGAPQICSAGCIVAAAPNPDRCAS